MKRLKHVAVSCHDAIGRYKNAKVSWCDVWLRFHSRRTTRYVAPTLCGYLDLMSEMDLTDAVIRDHPEEPAFVRDQAVNRWCVEAVKACGYAVDNSHDYEMPHIYSRHHLIDRAIAEELLTLWLRDSLYLNGPFKFHWKPPKHITRPVLIPTARVRQELDADSPTTTEPQPA